MSLSAGKVVCVTGASRGIGRATALEFAKHGAASLILHYYGDEATTDEIRTLKEELQVASSGCSAISVPGDIADRETSLKVRLRDQLTHTIVHWKHFADS